MSRDEFRFKLFTTIAEGLRDKPAYLLIFGLCALFMLSGIVNSVGGVIKGDYLTVLTGFVSFVLSLAGAIYVVNRIESGNEKGQNQAVDAPPERQENSQKASRCENPNDCVVRAVKDKGELEAVFRTPHMNEGRFIEALLRSECLMEGHFRLVSGRHSARFIRFSSILETPYSRDYFCNGMAEIIDDLDFTRIIGPSGTAGGRLASKVGEILDISVTTFPTAYGKRQISIPDVRARQLFGDRCVYVDDLTTTGAGLIAAVDELLSKNIFVVAAAVCFIRDQEAGQNLRRYLQERDVELVFLGYADLAAYTWEAKDCKLCSLISSEDMN